MENAREGEEETKCSSCGERKRNIPRSKKRELAISCMLNTEVGSLLAVIRRPLDPTQYYPEDSIDYSIVQSLKSLRAYIFSPQQEWHTTDPSIYLSAFLDVIQTGGVPAAATSVALQSTLKILKLGIFDEKTPGARDAINSVVSAVSQCHLEKTDPVFEDSVRMSLLQVLVGIMKHPSSVLLTEHAAANVIESCYNVFKSASKGDLLQRSAIYTMHELIQIIFTRLPEIEVREGEENGDGDVDDLDLVLSDFGTGYGVNCGVYIFELLCKLLNVAEVVEMEGAQSLSVDEDVQAFALILINNAIELSGEGIGKHPKLLRIIQDRLFHHLIHYGTRSSPLILSMITSTVLNIYYFLRRFIRVQLEAFFVHVLFRVTAMKGVIQQQEVAVEGVINFCRQPTFVMEVYVNYDCDPISRDVFEETGKLLCKFAFPGGGPLSPLQVQAFEGLVIMINNIAESTEKYERTLPLQPYPVQIREYRPFWEEQRNEDMETWVEYVRIRKAQKKKLLIAGNHFNRDEKKGLEYLKLCNLVSDPPDPKAYAYFFRFVPGLDKNAVGDYLGDPDEFHLRVLKEFTETFQFTGMTLDGALRTYLETFKMPGEAQKITRVLEAFSERYYHQQASEIIANKDAMFVMSYSLIMLNTDLHNPQVKKKMTEEEFIRNCRAINEGKDLPRDYLSDLFYSIATNEIKLKDQSKVTVGINPGQWFDLLNRSKTMLPFVLCDFEHSLGRDMFSTIAGPAVAALCAFFEQTDEDDILNECIEGMFSVAKIAQYGLEDTLDELLAAFCKFTTLLNPYASSEETLFVFSHEMKPRMATLAVFTIANHFGDSIRGGWRNVIDCLLKLKKLKLLPPSVLQPDDASASDLPQDSKSSSHGTGGMINKISSHLLSLDSMEDSLTIGTEFEQNIKVIKQCRIGNIFYNSTGLPDSTVINLGRCLIFAAAGKGQKFSTPVEEEETVGFCWDLLFAISSANVHRFQNFWPSFNDFLLTVAQFPLFSPVPFVEKAIVALFKICLKLFSSQRPEKLAEEHMFKSINLMRKLDKDIIDTCSEFIMQAVSKILIEYAGNVQTPVGWKSLLDLLEFTGRIPQTNEQGVQALITLLSDATHVSRINYAFCINCASSFIGLRVTPLEKNLKIMDLMAQSVSLLVQWHKNGSFETTTSYSSTSSMSVSSMDDSKIFGGSNYTLNLFVKLGEAIKKASLSRREEVRNQAVLALHKSFRLAVGLEFTSTNCINCINLVLFAMVDDLHEKMLQYSRRENSQREMRSMEGTLKISMEVVTDVYLLFVKQIAESPSFRTFWLGVLRRMDTCMKADLGEYGDSEVLQELVPDLLRKMITKMKEDEILVRRDDDDDDLWEITYIQIQWIAPSLKEELFPDA